MASDSDDIPSGLVLPGLQDDTRRGPLLAVLAVLTLAGISVVWPVYPLFRSIRPYILGFPLSFAWVVIWLLVSFAALVLFYRSDVSD